MRKKILIMCMAAMLIMTGCGDNSDGKNSSDTVKAAGTATQEVTKEETTTEEVTTEEETTTGRRVMSEEERAEYIQNSARAVIRYVGEILSNNPTYVVKSINTLDGHYVEMEFIAEKEPFDDIYNFEKSSDKPVKCIARAWVSDEDVQVTNCYFEYDKNIRANIDLGGKDFNAEENVSKYETEKKIIQEKCATTLYDCEWTSLEAANVLELYDEYMTEHLKNLDTVKREEAKVHTKKVLDIEDDYYYTYNENGITVKKKMVGRKGTYIDEFNNEGCIIYYEDPETKEKRQYTEKKEYDENNNLIKNSGYDNEACFGNPEWICEYDSKGNLIRLYTYDDKDITYEYDENGYVKKKLTYEYNYEGEKEFYSWVEYTHDSNGNMLRWVKCDSKGTELLSKNYTYDLAGNLIKMEQVEESYHPSGYEVTEYYRYDSNGRLIRKYVYGDNKNFSRITSYDAVGNEIKDDERDMLEYEYDDAGNIKSITKYVLNDEKEKEKRVYFEYDNKGRVVIAKDYLLYVNSIREFIYTEYTYFE